MLTSGSLSSIVGRMARLAMTGLLAGVVGCDRVLYELQDFERGMEEASWGDTVSVGLAGSWVELEREGRNVERRGSPYAVQITVHSQQSGAIYRLDVITVASDMGVQQVTGPAIVPLGSSSGAEPAILTGGAVGIELPYQDQVVDIVLARSVGTETSVDTLRFVLPTKYTETTRFRIVEQMRGW